MNPLSALINLILPRVCHLCGDKLLEEEEFVCSSCLSRLPRTNYEKYWDKPGVSGQTDTVPTVNSDLNPMEQKFAAQIPLQRACAPFFYSRDSSLSQLIHDFKYRGFSRLAACLGKVGAEALNNSGLFNDVELILPIPLHWTKLMKRGYNQTEMIAQGISEITGIPIGKHLKARKAHRTQTSLNSHQRIENTKGIFKIVNPEELRGKTILLVDDICTTGATLLSAGEALATSTNHQLKLRLFTLGVV